MTDLRDLIQTSGSGLIFLLSYDGWHCVPHRDFQHLPRPKDYTEVLNAPYVHVSVDTKIDYEASFDSRLKLDGGKETISQIIFVLSRQVMDSDYLATQDFTQERFLPSLRSD